MGTTVNSFSISVIIPAYNAEKTKMCIRDRV